MSDTPKPPFPLPDLPRLPPSELSRLICRVVEHRDYDALRALPDMLRDLNRDGDARAVMRCLVGNLDNRPLGMLAVVERKRFPWVSVPVDVSTFTAIAQLLWWDVFDWNAVCLATAAAAEDRDLASKKLPLSPFT